MSQYANIAGTSIYPAAVNITTAPDSITSKAQRVLGMVQQVESVLTGIESRVHPPAPTNVSGAPPAPEPSHVVFTLQDAEQRLGTMLKRMESLRDAL